MKRIHILLIILIAACIGAILTSLSDASTYATFSEAALRPKGEFHVVGKLNRDKEMIYNPQADPNKFTFFMTDSKGTERRVILEKAKPQDFDKSEQIVVVGKCEGNDFRASDILMKCPSKYNNAQAKTGN